MTNLMGKLISLVSYPLMDSLNNLKSFLAIWSSFRSLREFPLGSS